MSLVSGCLFLTPAEQYLLQHVCGAWTIDDALPALRRHLTEQEKLLKSSSGGVAQQQSPDLAFVELERKLQNYIAGTSRKRPRAETSEGNSSPRYAPFANPDFVPLRELLLQQREQQQYVVPTFSFALDHALHGGIHLGELTEVAGSPGAGKTQLLMQLAVSAFLPKLFGGLGSTPCADPAFSPWRRRFVQDGDAAESMNRSRVLYIDTEGSFSVNRFREIAAAAVVQVTKIANQPRWGAQLRPQELQQLREEVSLFQVEEMTKRVEYVSVRSAAELVAVTKMLPSTVASMPDLALVILDSLALPLRQVTEESHHLRSAIALSHEQDVAAGGEGTSPRTGRGGNSPPSSTTSYRTAPETAAAPATRSRIAFAAGQALQNVARTTGVAIVVSNHVTSQYCHGGGGRGELQHGGPALLVPALGEAWGHCVSTRVMLTAAAVQSVFHSESFGVTQRRRVEVWKSPRGGRGACEVFVCGAGIRNAQPVNAPN